MRIHKTLIVVALATVPPVAAAQQFLAAPTGAAVDPNSRFEVASVKAIAGDSQMMMRMLPTGQFEAIGVPVGLILRQALQKADYQIVGAPGWINTERYTILAKAPEGTPPLAMTVMLVNLLKDRFQMATHVETRELPIFNLVMARADGRLGPDLKVTPEKCQTEIAERIAAAKAAAAGRGGMPPLPAFDPNGPMPCGFLSIPPGRIVGTARTLAQIIPTVADLVGRPVIDKTGLTGMYDFTIKYQPDGRFAGPFGPPRPSAQNPPVDPDAPSFITALQEQLGLKLENARGPVEVVVIDKFERPTLD